MNAADRQLTPYRDQIEELRRQGKTWTQIGKAIGKRVETVRDWCEGWMDPELLKDLPRGYHAQQAARQAARTRADERFAQAMGDRAFASLKVTPDRRMTMQAPSGYVPREANS